MLDKVRATIKKYSMFNKGDSVLVGLSGGPDSVALTHILYTLADELELTVSVAHLNHRLRGSDSDEDAEFAGGFAARLGLKAVIEGRDVAGFASEKRLSIQTAAREVRYSFFQEAAENLGCNKLATGHNANDQAETLLFNLLRGSGLLGLSGIPPVRGDWIVRPLIETERYLIEDYCAKNRLDSRLDKSNLKSGYTRNKLRLNLIPHLQKEYNPNLVETLVRTSGVFREEEALLEEITADYWASICLGAGRQKVSLSIERLNKAPVNIRKRIIRKAWQQISKGAGQIGFIHLADAVELLEKGQTGSAIILPGGVQLAKSYSKAILTIPGKADEKEFCIRLNVPGITKIPGTEYSVKTELLDTQPSGAASFAGPKTLLLDVDKTGLPLLVRTRKPGDWFRPVGLIGSQKLKKFLIDHKIPRDERRKLALLVTEGNQLVWLVGIRPDQRWLAGKDTKRALKLELTQDFGNQN